MWTDHFCLLLLSAFLFCIQWAGQITKYFTSDSEMPGQMKSSYLTQVFVIHKTRICFHWAKHYNFIDLWSPWITACDWLVVSFPHFCLSFPALSSYWYFICRKTEKSLWYCLHWKGDTKWSNHGSCVVHMRSNKCTIGNTYEIFFMLYPMVRDASWQEIQNH